MPEGHLPGRVPEVRVEGTNECSANAGCERRERHVPPRWPPVGSSTVVDVMRSRSTLAGLVVAALLAAMLGQGCSTDAKRTVQSSSPGTTRDPTPFEGELATGTHDGETWTLSGSKGGAPNSICLTTTGALLTRASESAPPAVASALQGLSPSPDCGPIPAVDDPRTDPILAVVHDAGPQTDGYIAGVAAGGVSSIDVDGLAQPIRGTLNGRGAFVLFVSPQLGRPTGVTVNIAEHRPVRCLVHRDVPGASLLIC